jgi:hypothetical protein
LPRKGALPVKANFKIISAILCLFFLSVTGQAKTIATQTGRASLELSTKRGEVTVRFQSTSSLNYLVDIFYGQDGSRPFDCEKARATQILSGTSIQWTDTFEHGKMGDSWISVTACIYRVGTNGAALETMLTESIFAQGMD